MSDEGEIVHHKNVGFDRVFHRTREEIGGGYLVFRRGRRTNRIHIPKQAPFEHPDRASADAEAKRLADKFPGKTFVVYEEVSQAYSAPPDGELPDSD